MCYAERGLVRQGRVDVVLAKILYLVFFQKKQQQMFIFFLEPKEGLGLILKIKQSKCMLVQPKLN